MKYRVENRHRVWDTYDSEEKALEMMRYLNDRYHNDNYIVEVEEEEMTEVKYAVIYGDDRNEEIEFFDTLEEANRYAKNTWEHMSDYDKKRNHVETIDIHKEDLSDPDDWMSYTAYGYCSGRFDSDR